MRAIAAAAILCVTLTGCRTVSVQSVAYSPDKPNVGIVYALPMRKL